VAAGFAPGDHGSTFGGNPLACAAALAVLDEYEASGLVEAAAERGQELQDALCRVAAEKPQIRQVRGRGLMIGVELAKGLAGAVKAGLFAKGFLVGSVGESIIRILPPLILPPQLIAPFAEALTATLEEVSPS
jgi:acetylornithine aminotransferase/acetylornithine/N-succinyldiaminopimelate aminotransferase